MKGGRGKKTAEPPKRGRGKKADTIAPAAPSKVTKKAPAKAKAKAPAKSAAKKGAVTPDALVDAVDDVPRNRFVTPEEQKTPRSRRIVRDLVITPSRQRTIDQHAGESPSKGPPPPPKKAKPQRPSDTVPASSRLTGLNSGTSVATPTDKNTPNADKSTPKSSNKTPVKRKSLLPNEIRNLHPERIPGVFFKTLAVPQPDWDDSKKPNWAKTYHPHNRLGLAQRNKKILPIQHDAYITEKGYNRLKKIYADIDKRLPNKFDTVYFTSDRDGYAIIEVLENNLRDYFNELTSAAITADPNAFDIIHLYTIAEALILFLVSKGEDYQWTQVDDGYRVESLANLFACMMLDLVRRLHIYKDLFTRQSPLKSLPLLLGVAISQFEDFQQLYGFNLDGGQGVDEETTAEEQEAMEAYSDAVDLLKVSARKAKIPLYNITDKGLEVLDNPPEDGDKDFDVNWINVDFEQQCWDHIGESPVTMALAYRKTIEDMGFGGRRYMPGYKEWVIVRRGGPNDY